MTTNQAPALDDRARRGSLAALAVGALGVVYGDIGTSPLYTVQEIFAGTHPLPVTADNILGTLSLIFWALTIVVSLKYVVFIMQADNKGEGGIMALMALVQQATRTRPRLNWLLLTLGLFGAGLFYGDGMITPAISVLSAVEGLSAADASLSPLVEPLSIIILSLLFFMQRKGTHSVGRLFGPIMAFWFAAIALLGLWHVLHAPQVLLAIDPRYGLRFFLEHGVLGFIILGTVVLAVTGAEAIYSDMGHFGKQPIRLGWFAWVMPALVLSYFGQGALLMRNPQAISNPFFLQAPAWGILPLTLLATIATVIASQAVITGAYSLTREAIQLGYLPRLRILHTSVQQIGQIYIPAVNAALYVGVILLVLGFGSSSGLAAAYGTAVTGTMLISTVLGFVVVRYLWRWNPYLTYGGLAVFLIVDLAFFSANLLKIPHGGWSPLLIGLALFVMLSTWKRGRALVRDRLQHQSIALEPFLANLNEYPPTRVPGTAVFLSTHNDIAPPALLHNLAHNKVLHERVVFLTSRTEDVPFVPRKDRYEVRDLGHNFLQLTLHYGFKDEPDIPAALAECDHCGEPFNLLETSFFLSRETLIATELPGMALWREKVFVSMARNAQHTMNFFKIPPNRVIELGTQIEL